jgi:hypothetical protein
MKQSVRGRLTALGGALAALLAAGPARADSSGMDWIGVVYLWATEISVDSRDRSVDIAFSDIVDKLEMAFLGHVEAQGEDFGGFADVVFMGLGNRESRQAADLNTDLDMTLMDLALVWSPSAEPFSGVEVFGGLRYIDVDFGLVVDPVPPALPDVRTGIDKEYADVLLGARYAAPINEHWRLVFGADLSDGDTEGTWSIGGFGVYRNGAHRLYAGYRHLEVELAAQGGDERVKQTFSGPAIGYGFAF